MADKLARRELALPYPVAQPVLRFSFLEPRRPLVHEEIVVVIATRIVN